MSLNSLKDDELAAVAVLVGHERVIEDRVELVPLGIVARADHIASEILQSLEARDLSVSSSSMVAAAVALSTSSDSSSSRSSWGASS